MEQLLTQLYFHIETHIINPETHIINPHIHAQGLMMVVLRLGNSDTISRQRR